MSEFFSESWHRVAKTQIGLVASVQIHKQRFRGVTWYVLRDTFNDKFFRIRPEAYQFLMHLTPEKTVQEVWLEFIEKYPTVAPGQEELIQLLSQLHDANLLYFKNRTDSSRIFERYQKQKYQKKQQQVLSIFFSKFSLLDPDAFLNRILPLIQNVFSVKAALIWFAIVISGGVAVIEHFDELRDQSQGLLAPDNLFWFFVALFFLKLWHEFGHAMMCKRFGGQVHSMGVMLLILTPLPFMDASASWAFRSRWHRALVGAAGMIAELFVAGIAALIWANTGAGTLHSLCFNVMTIASISSLVFNGNPLIRFDAYYILSDILEIPNLAQKSQRQWLFWIQKYAFGVDDISPAQTIKESVLLGIYGLLSFLYRLLISVGIILFTADEWLFLGFLMAMLTGITLIVIPAYRAANYLLLSQKIHRKKSRTYSVLAVFLLLVSLLCFIPYSSEIEATGIVESTHFTSIFVETNGYLKKVNVKNGQLVSQGDTLLEFENNELALSIQSLNAKITEEQILLTQARNENIADLDSIEKYLLVLEEHLASLQKDEKKLNVIAQQSGIWVAPEFTPKQENWFKRGMKLGSIINPKQYRFTAVVTQEQAFDLFEGNANTRGEVKVRVDTQPTFNTNAVQIIPYERRELPSAALGWLGGGDIAVTHNAKSSGKEAAESFFEVRADIQANETEPFFHGSSGILRLELPPKSLISKVAKTINQTLLKRYKLT
ncbi:MAG: biotin/lipoyl-binding protein [Methylococcales bacterium]|nr:biotin/lipoyl-binding protein [Methylococcales bacterium]